jgi:hypothetical protein
MRWTFRVLTAAALAVCAAAAYADPPGRVARLNYAAGTVSFAPGEAPDHWVQAVLNRPLTGGDRLWADRDGRAEFQVGSTAVRMAPQTSVDVLHLDDDRVQLRLAQGSANLRVRVLDPEDVVEVATPSGAVLIREPGSYRITVDPDDELTRVAVNFGQADVITSGRDLRVASGQVVAVSAYAPAAFEVAGAADEFDRWSAERDRRNERVASTRYVSPHMTGHEDLDHYGTWRTVPEYGAVWTPARVAPGWAPYRHGHWAWISPWGWTWIDDAPWGFAPFHYGRWVHVHDRWAWAPGPIVRRPVYAPALVAFVGGSGWSVSVSNGPAVGWFPLGWREPFHPWYRASHRHVHNVNVTHVTNVTNITRVRHVHRHRPEAVTVVSRQNFVSARPVASSRVNVARADLARAEVIRNRRPAEPVRASIAQDRRGRRPPAQAAAREVVAVNPPAPVASRQAALNGRDDADGRRARAEQPRVRVLDRETIQARRAAREARREDRDERRAPAAPAAVQAAPAQARVEAEQRGRAEAGQRARAAAEQRRRAQAEDRARAEAEQRARVQSEQRARFEGEQRARAEEARPRAQVRREAAVRGEPSRERGPQRRESLQREPRTQRFNAPAPTAAAPAAPVPAVAAAPRREAPISRPAAPRGPQAARQAPAPRAVAAPAPRPQAAQPQRGDSRRQRREGPGRPAT